MLCDYGSNFCAIGNGLPNPNARDVIFNPGGACLRLYSARSTRDATARTNSKGKLTFIGDFARAADIFDIELQNSIEDIVGRKGILICLIRTQLGGWRFCEACLRDQFPAVRAD